jgi:hypothetical protein
MQENIPVPVVEELAVLIERAEIACKTTAELVREFNFILVWYRSRPRFRLRAHPMLDETSTQEQTRDSLSDLLDVPGIPRSALNQLGAPTPRTLT